MFDMHILLACSLQQSTKSCNASLGGLLFYAETGRQRYHSCTTPIVPPPPPTALHLVTLIRCPLTQYMSAAAACQP